MTAMPIITIYQLHHKWQQFNIQLNTMKCNTCENGKLYNLQRDIGFVNKVVIIRLGNRTNWEVSIHVLDGHRECRQNYRHYQFVWMKMEKLALDEPLNITGTCVIRRG